VRPGAEAPAEALAQTAGSEQVAVRIARIIAYDIELPDTITFECPNSRELASFVIAEVLRAPAAAAPGAIPARQRGGAGGKHRPG
jgi:hypothetical protein